MDTFNRTKPFLQKDYGHIFRFEIKVLEIRKEDFDKLLQKLVRKIDDISDLPPAPQIGHHLGKSKIPLDTRYQYDTSYENPIYDPQATTGTIVFPHLRLMVALVETNVAPKQVLRPKELDDLLNTIIRDQPNTILSMRDTLKINFYKAPTWHLVGRDAAKQIVSAFKNGPIRRFLRKDYGHLFRMSIEISQITKEDFQSICEDIDTQIGELFDPPSSVQPQHDLWFRKIDVRAAYGYDTTSTDTYDSLKQTGTIQFSRLRHMVELMPLPEFNTWRELHAFLSTVDSLPASSHLLPWKKRTINKNHEPDNRPKLGHK